jgi:hypothetical protein
MSLQMFYTTITYHATCFVMDWTLMLGFAFCCPQPVWLKFMRNPAQDHPPGWLLLFFPWDVRGGNSKAVRSTELMMEFNLNDCLFEVWDEQAAKTHIERWADKSEVETHIFRFGHIQDKQEGKKMLGDPGVCHHCYCPAPHFLTPSSIFSFKPGKQCSERLWKLL